MESPLVCCVGDLVEDVVVQLATNVRRGSDAPARIERHRGGSAAGAAVAVVRAGGRARFVGRIGDDETGRRLVASLEGAGVEPLVQREGTTGTIVVLVSAGGERSFLTDRGAALDLAAVDRDQALADAAWLHVPWYSLHAGAIAATSASLLRRATASAVPTSIDASSVALLDQGDADRFQAAVEEYRPRVVFSNAEEAERLGIDPERGMRGAELTIVKRADEALLLHARGEQPAKIPAPSLTGPVIDTTGAGDAFAGTVIVELLRGKDASTAVVEGHSAAGVIVQRLGSSPVSEPDGQDGVGS